MIKMRSVTIMFAMMGAITSSGQTQTPGQITININTNNNRQAISPYIYGYNGCPAGARNLTFCRYGGNRLTAYNWENNYSNAGSDYLFQNDNGLDSSTAPGDAVRSFITATQNSGATALITVPIVDYVAGDAAGPVASSDYQSLRRFKANKMRKGSAFTLTPDPNDGFVYQDEFVNWVKTNFASSEAQNKFVFYSLDNEPDLWAYTHPEVHTAPVTYAELVGRTIAAASAIKDNATPASMVFGPVSYGYNGYTSLQNASDANGRDFLNFYLDSMAQAQVTYGRRLVDVLDLHWYPEAQGGGIRITGDDTSPAVVAARLQAPRSLWDPTYNESSWIQSSIGGPIQLIPMLKAKITAHYPATKLAFTEYNYGAGGDISGGLAQADVLGIFGQQGVFAANMWPLSSVTYIDAAFQMYQDPAGNGTKVGDTSVSTTNSDIVDASAYGFTNGASSNEVDAVVLNKTASPMTATIQITNPLSVNSVKIYQLTSASAVPQPVGAFAVQNNQYQYTMPAYSVSTLVFTAGSNPTPATHDFNDDLFSDIAWRDNSGNVAIWLISGNQLLQGAGIGAADPTIWKIVGQRDFNGDGKADLLWNDTSGHVAIWFMNGTQVSQYANAPSAPGWTVVGTGDFNGDGMGDILWQNASGSLAIWLMNGAQISAGGAGGIGTLPSGWTVAGTGDFNKDGKTDILFHYTSGAVAIWFLNGLQVSQYGSGPPAGSVWSVVATGDFNGDGYSDILWRDATNDIAVWLMQGTSIFQAGGIGNVGSNWTVAQTGDFNGDGKSDILWRDTTGGNIAMWYMNGVAVSQYVGAGSVSLNWTILGANAD
jgi:Glycoside hydrolase family 44/FG-GAP-like repeat